MKRDDKKTSNAAILRSNVTIIGRLDPMPPGAGPYVISSQMYAKLLTLNEEELANLGLVRVEERDE